MKSVRIASVVMMLVLVAAVAGCALAAPTSTPPTVYEVGQVAEKAGIQAVLNSYEMVDGQLHLNFTITNKSTHEFNVSTRYSMEGQSPEGTKLVFMMCPENELGGRIAVGESITGFVCLKGVDTPAGARVLYDPTHQRDYTIAWELK